MKKSDLIRSILHIGLFILIINGMTLKAQEMEMKDAITLELKPFSKINIKGAVEILLMQADAQLYAIQLPVEQENDVKAIVRENMLYLDNISGKNHDYIVIKVKTPGIDHIEINGKAMIKSEGTITGDSLSLIAGGSANVDLDLSYRALNSMASGAADVFLSGEAESHYIKAGGASKVDAEKLRTSRTEVISSAAGVALVNATEKLYITVNDAGAVQYLEKPNTVTINEPLTEDETGRSYVIRSEYGDSTRVKLGRMEIKVIENDSTTVTLGRHTLVVDENGDVKYRRNKKRKFNGHWGGVELGINGYLTPDHDMNFKKKDEYLDLRMEKSIAVHLNIFEQNFALSRNKQFGILTGLGMEFHNYRFRLPTTLTPDSSVLVGFVDRNIQVRKSKLVVNYFVLPILFEWQTNQYCRKNSFHITAGVILGVRFSSHTKKYYDELNKQYYLTKYDPELGDYIPVYQRVSPSENKERRKDDYHLHPFKVDGSFRIGWGVINLFANYSFTTLFRKEKGPELYPFTVGIALVGW